MKTLTLITLLFLISCNSKEDQELQRLKDLGHEAAVNSSYEQIAINQFNSLVSPVILIGKEKTMMGHNISVIDKNGKVQTFGDLSIIGGSIGASRKIGDTLK